MPDRNLRVLAGSLIVVLAAACTSGPSASAPASAGLAQPSPSLQAFEPTSSPTPTDPAATEVSWALDPPEPLLMNSFVRVTVDELNVRRRPGLEGRILGAVRRDQLLIVDEMAPVEADGYVWYSVTETSLKRQPDLGEGITMNLSQLVGWVATSTSDGSFVKRLASRCPATPTLSNVGAMFEAEMLSCFEARTLELEGFIRCGTSSCFEDFPGTYEPAWLAHPAQLGLLMTVDRREALTIRFPPELGGEPAEEMIVRMRGHFDDVRSAGCAMREAFPWRPEGPTAPFGVAVARELCRQRFVVESFDVLGPAPTRA